MQDKVNAKAPCFGKESNTCRNGRLPKWQPPKRYTQKSNRT